MRERTSAIIYGSANELLTSKARREILDANTMSELEISLARYDRDFSSTAAVADLSHTHTQLKVSGSQSQTTLQASNKLALD